MTTLLLTLAAVIAPGVSLLDQTRQEAVLSIMAAGIASRPRPLQRQLSLFLWLVRWLPVLRYARPFDRLDRRQQRAVLDWLMHTSIKPLRRGFWGLKTLVYMGYYGHPDVAREIGYRPSFDGNNLLRAR